MVPGRVVAHIFLDHAVCPLELFGLVEEIEALDQPLPVAPHMVVLGVQFQHGVYELWFALT